MPDETPRGSTARRAIDHADELSSDAPGAEEVQVVPWPLLLRQRVLDRVEQHARYPWIVLTTVLFGLFSVGFTITILSNSIPRIARDLDSDISTLTWVLTGPLLAFAVVGPAAGKLGDLKGQRKIYLASTLFVALFAALTALAPNAGALILFRVLGAATGAASGPASLAIINRMLPPARRAQAMGYWAMVGAGGPVVGVVAGGPIVEAFGWRWIFAAQVPLTLATFVLAAVVLPETRRREARFDMPGAVTLGLGAMALLLAINRGPVWGWDHPGVVAAFAAAPVLVAWFVLVERRAAHPLLPLAYIGQRNFALPLLTQLFTNFAYMGGFIITPLLLQNEFGYGETKTGTMLIARPLVFAVAGPVAGYLTLRIGERTSAVFGALSIGLSMLGLAAVAPGSSDLVVVGALALSGLGMGTSSPAMAAAIANAVDERDLGIAGATQQMINQIGIVIGIQVMQTVQAARASSVGEVAAYGDAYLVGFGACVLGLAAALFVKTQPRLHRDDEAGEREVIVPDVVVEGDAVGLSGGDAADARREAAAP
jgi:EmrB/QacA subfamily drug resistance transporter